MKFPKLDNLGARERAMLLFAGLALCCMVLSLLALPFIKGVDKIEVDCQRKDRELGYALSLVKSAEAVEADFRRVEAMLGVSLSDAESISGMKEELEDMARGAGLTVEPPSHREPVAEATLPWREYVVELPKCEGTMESLVAFAGLLEEAPVVYRIERISVAPSKTPDAVTASIVVSRIMLPPEQDQAVSKDI